MAADKGWVLVVEDDDFARNAVCKLLGAHGFAALPAGDGREALAVLRRATDPPAALLLDLHMPAVDGWEVLELRRHDPDLAAVPVAVMSGVRGAEDCLARGANVVLHKPLDARELLHTVGRLAGAD